MKRTKGNSVSKKTLTSYVEIKNIISQILFGDELSSILEVILIHVESKLPEVRASIFLYDEKNNCLINGAAPSMPESFCQKINGLHVGPTSASSGAAAYFRTATVARDIHTDPLWTSHLELAKEYNMRACWAIPILNMRSELLGTFALYYKTTHKPGQKEKILMQELVDIACLAIERDHMAALKKQSEEEIQTQRTNALNSLKHVSLGEMAKNISHEINSPLAVILGSVHLMNRIIDQDGFDKDKLKMHTERLGRSVKRIEKIVNGLSSITREASDDPFIKIDAKKVIDDALSIYQERFISSNIELRLSGDLEAIFECRSTQISQVIVNIINNSYEAIHKSSNPWIEIHVLQSAQQIRLEITDSGDGIPQLVAQKIMIPLFTTKIHAKATGLGLSVSQALIQEHSGKIWYDNSCQHTRFVIELPLEQIPSLKQAA